MENNKIDRLFQDRLSRYEMEPSAGAWEAVQAQLAPQRRPIMWYAVAAAVAVLVITYMIVMSLGAEAYSRFRVPVLPLYAMLAGGGAAAFVNRWLHPSK